MLMLHIIISLATVASATGSLALGEKRLLKITPYMLGATLASGVGLLLAVPSVSITHLCVSGVMFSLVTIVLHRLAVRRFAAAS